MYFSIFFLLLTKSVFSKEIAITIDDLPGWYPVHHRIATKTLTQIATHLKNEKVPATGYVIGKIASFSKDSKESLETWAGMGFHLANHSWKHIPYKEVEAKTFWKEVDQTEEILKPLRAKYGPWPVSFRFPMLNQGNTEVKAKIANEYFEKTKTLLAHVSIDNSDWAFAEYYVKAKTAQKKKRIEDLYLEHILDCVKYAEESSEKIFAKQIPQILLMHANTLNAKMLGTIIQKLKESGYRFIDFQTAMNDQTYKPYQYKIAYIPADHFSLIWRR